MNSQIKRFLWTGINLIAKKASRNYIAGPALSDAQRVSNYLSHRGYSVTHGFWDSTDDSPDHIFETYQASMEKLAELKGENYLSIKIPSLNYNVGMYHTILSKSHQLGVPIHFDSLAPAHASQIFSFIKEHTESPFDNIGCTLPGRWRRSIDDAELVNELGLNVRVVKGQWVDPDAPILDVRSGYLQVIDRLAGKSRCVRVATHDAPLAKEALTRLKASNTRCELELLYGLPFGHLISFASELAIPVRIYVAYGHAYLPYALSSIKKNPKMILPLLREAFKSNYLSSFPIYPLNKIR